MQQGEKGTWTSELKGNQKGLFYTYKVKIGDKWTEAVDPYVRAASVNGDKGAVVNLEETNPKNGKQTKSQNLKIRKMLLFMSYMYAIFPFNLKVVLNRKGSI